MNHDTHSAQTHSAQIPQKQDGRKHQLTNLGVIYFMERVFFLTLCTCKPTNRKSLFPSYVMLYYTFCFSITLFPS